MKQFTLSNGVRISEKEVERLAADAVAIALAKADSRSTQPTYLELHKAEARRVEKAMGRIFGDDRTPQNYKAEPSGRADKAQAAVASGLTSVELATKSVTARPSGKTARRDELEAAGGKNVTGADAVAAQIRINRAKANRRSY